MGQILDVVIRAVYLPFELLGLASDRPLIAVSVVLVLIVVVAVGAWRYQRCPHCRSLVPRARGAWLRCLHCGRQYHRGLRQVR